jgi:cyclopropane-fatty-acyl-phospholipid synthase
MAACALEFEAEGTGIYQILVSKRGGNAFPLPLTRYDLYRQENQNRIGSFDSLTRLGYSESW